MKPWDKAEKLRIILSGARIDFHRHDGESWRLVGSQSRRGLEGDPSLLCLGKMAENGSCQGFPQRALTCCSQLRAINSCPCGSG